jgi:hypothetical protein
MKKLSLILLALFAFACGAPPEYLEAAGIDDDVEMSAEPDELGEVEQAITIRPQHGWRSDLGVPDKGQTCASPTSGPSSQICNFPNSRTVTFRCGNGFTAGELTLCEQFVDSEVQALIGQYGPTWQFGRVASNAVVTFTKQANNTPGSSTTVKPYFRITPACSANLGEPETVFFNGAARVCHQILLDVDWAKIDASIGSAAGRTRVKAHTIGIGAALGVGLGLDTPGIDNTRKNSSVITLGAGKAINHTDRDRCRVNGYNPANPTVIDSVGPGCV